MDGLLVAGGSISFPPFFFKLFKLFGTPLFYGQYQYFIQFFDNPVFTVHVVLGIVKSSVSPMEYVVCMYEFSCTCSYTADLAYATKCTCKCINSFQTCT